MASKRNENTSTQNGPIETSPANFIKASQNKNNSIAITVPEAVPTAKNITNAFDNFYASAS